MTLASYGVGAAPGRHRWYGPVLGLLVTGVGLAVAELFAGFSEQAKSPVVAVAEEFVDWTPPALEDWAIETFGASDKQVLIGGVLLTLLLVGLGVGMMAVVGRVRAAIGAVLVIGVIGGWAVLSRPSADIGDLLPTIAGTGASLGVLWWLGQTRRPGASVSDVEGDAHESPMAAIDRRSFVTGAVAIGSVAAIAGGAGRLLRGRFSVAAERRALTLPAHPERLGPLPSDADLPIEGISPFVVPNDDFYRVDTALVVPQVSTDEWSLSIGGMVDHELTIDFDELLAMPQVERHVTLSCVSNPVGGPYVGNALWQGVLLTPILERAAVQPGAEQLVSRSHDGWTAGSPIDQVMDGRDTMLAIGMNGEPLPASHGYPVRLVVPGLYGYVSATKWVTELEITTWDAFDAYWVPRGWAAEAPFKMTSRIDTPRDGSTHTAGEVVIAGVAWKPNVGISAVDVSIDGGDWAAAELGGVPSNDTWRQWMYRWDATPGDHEITVRATDNDGEVQIAEEAPTRPDGASGYHRVTVNVA